MHYFFTISSEDMEEMDCLNQSIAPSGLHKNTEKMSLFSNPQPHTHKVIISHNEIELSKLPVCCSFK